MGRANNLFLVIEIISYNGHNLIQDKFFVVLTDNMTSYFRLFISVGLSQKNGPSMENVPMEKPIRSIRVTGPTMR